MINFFKKRIVDTKHDIFPLDRLLSVESIYAEKKGQEHLCYYEHIPRAQRVDVADYYYHVINRASARLTLFESKEDYGIFESVLVEAVEKYDMRLIAYCCMPNHFHLILQPKNDGDLSKFMYWFSM